LEQGSNKISLLVLDDEERYILPGREKEKIKEA
jgi:hypothetical protein